MRITLGNIDGKALGLNASEACVYAAIEKCSRGENAKGWYGTLHSLVEVLPFVTSKPTLSRAVTKLLTKGLVKKVGESYYTAFQNETKPFQNETQSFQNETQSFQNELPPNNPPINNKKMNEEIKEQPRADMRTRDGKAPHCAKLAGTPLQQQCSVERLVKGFSAFKRTMINLGCEPGEFRMRENACYSEWRIMSVPKQQAILDELNLATMTKKQPEHWKDNPLFFLRDFPEPEPKDYNGARLLPNEPLVIAKYNDRAGLYTRREAELFGMNILRPFVP